jgi:subtilisin-like proprotein convertase family protein
LNTETAVKLARPAPRNSVLISRTFNQSLPDLRTVSVSLVVGESERIASLAVQVDITHTYISDLVVTLIPPSGTSVPAVKLHDRQGGATRNLKRVFDASNTPALAGFTSKNLKGSWKLQIRDAAVRDVGVLNSFGLELTFASPPRLVVEPNGSGTAPSRRRTAVVTKGT